MRIAMVDVILEPTRPGASGLSDVVWGMARELTSSGDQVVLLGLYSPQASLPPGDVEVHRLNPAARAVALMESVGFNIIRSSFMAARKLMRIPPPDVVLAPDFVSGGIVASLTPRLPVVCNTQGNIYERIATNTNPFGWPRTQVYKLATHLAVRNCAHIVAVSAAMRDSWVRSGAQPNRIAVIPLGTDVAFFRRNPEARERLGIEKGVELILFAGRFSKEKNIPLILRAVAALAPRRPALRLHLCGAGPDENNLRLLARKLDIESIVTFAGWADRDRLPDYYSAADVFVLPSIGEPLARAALEAMACETLVFATEVGGSPDVITHEKNGLLLPPDNVDAWRDAIARAFDDPAWRLEQAAAGRTVVTERFSWAMVVRRFREEIFPRAILHR